MNERAALGLLVELISIYSPSGGESQIIDWLEDYAGRNSITSRRVASENGRESLVFGSCREPVLAFCAHVDTITPTWADATVPKVNGTIVRGLGAVDDKGGVVACLLAIEEIRESGKDLDELPVVFTFAVDEETGGSGSRSLAIDLQPRFAIALEGTGLHPGVIECGDLEATITVRGVSAHGSHAELGDNAVQAAARLITSLNELRLDRFEHPLLGKSRATVNQIATGAGMNVIPNACDLNLQITMVPGQDLHRTIREVEKFAAGFDATVSMIEGTVPFELPSDSPLLLSIRGATRAVRDDVADPIGVPAWTDAHNFVDFGGSEAVVIGPGVFDSAHTAGEFIDVIDIVECGRMFAALLEPRRIEAMLDAPPREDPPRYLRTTS